MDKPKSGIGLLLVGKPKGEPGAEEGDGMGGKSAATDAVMAAIESKDKAALESALTSFVEACGYGK